MVKLSKSYGTARQRNAEGRRARGTPKARFGSQTRAGGFEFYHQPHTKYRRYHRLGFHHAKNLHELHGNRSESD